MVYPIYEVILLFYKNIYLISFLFILLFYFNYTNFVISNSNGRMIETLHISIYMLYMKIMLLLLPLDISFL